MARQIQLRSSTGGSHEPVRTRLLSGGEGRDGNRHGPLHLSNSGGALKPCRQWRRQIDTGNEDQRHVNEKRHGGCLDLVSRLARLTQHHLLQPPQ